MAKVIVLNLKMIKCSNPNCIKNTNNKIVYYQCEVCQNFFCDYHLMVTPIEMKDKMLLLIYCGLCSNILNY